MKISLLLLFWCALFAPKTALALEYPSQPIRLIVPFPPGGSVDYIARIITPKLSEQLGQPIYIENKGGASGVIGTTEVAKALPDGYTLLLAFDTHATNQYLYKLTYDTFASFDYITEITSSPLLLVVPKGSPVNSIQDLITKAKNQPDGITYGSSGIGSSNHLSALIFADKSKIKATHIPYKGGGPMLTAAMSGEVDFVITSMPVILNQVKDSNGKLKAIGISSKTRMPQLPNTPTISSVIPGYVAESWIGLLAPAGLPDAIKTKLSDAIKKTLASPEIKNRLSAEGFEIINSSPQAFNAKVENESKRLGEMIRQNTIKLD